MDTKIGSAIVRRRGGRGYLAHDGALHCWKGRYLAHVGALHFKARGYLAHAGALRFCVGNTKIQKSDSNTKKNTENL